MKNYVLFIVLSCAVAINAFAQVPNMTDDKSLVMGTIQGIPENDKSFGDWLVDVENESWFFGYTGYALAGEVNELHGAIFGVSIKNFMVDAEVSWGHVIDNGIYASDAELRKTKGISCQKSLMAVVQGYYKLFSFGVGLGGVSELGESKSTKITNNGDLYSIATEEISYYNGWFFDIRPTVRGYIPLSSRDSYSNYPVSLFLSAGYDIVPDNTDLNQWSFGIGLKFVF
ncbi:MAG: hypothetical protein K5920_02640 [Bacteroidales bacterium]|nr:hypothetical protein [Bacteroidales bacterium]